MIVPPRTLGSAVARVGTHFTWYGGRVGTITEIDGYILLGSHVTRGVL